MKIAHISPHWSPIREDRLIGIKRIVYNLYNEQTKRGHEVYIIAPKGSEIGNSDRLIETTEPSKNFNIYASDPRSLYYGVIHAGLAAGEASKFDIFHSHIEQVFLPFIPLINTPVVSTIHGTEFTEDEKFIFKSYFDKFHAVSISKKSADINREIVNFNYQVYNGVDTSSWPVNLENTEDYMIFIGRINSVKGVVEAAKIANQSQKRLKVVGFKEIGAEDYFEDLKREESDFVKYEGEVFETARKHDLFSKAKLFLFPVQYEETFASTPLESMAAGTPVIAFARGSLPEQVKDGVTGFLVNPSDDDIRGDFIIKKTGEEGLKEAVEKIYSMSQEGYYQMRQNSRKLVEENFTVEKMVDGYEEVYNQILAKS